MGGASWTNSKEHLTSPRNIQDRPHHHQRFPSSFPTGADQKSGRIKFQQTKWQGQKYHCFGAPNQPAQSTASIITPHNCGDFYQTNWERQKYHFLRSTCLRESACARAALVWGLRECLVCGCVCSHDGYFMCVFGLP